MKNVSDSSVFHPASQLNTDQLLPSAAVGHQDVVLHVGQCDGELVVLPADGGLQLL